MNKKTIVGAVIGSIWDLVQTKKEKWAQHEVPKVRKQ